MANVKGTRKENVVIPPIGDKPLGKPISVRYDEVTDELLRSLGSGMQQFIRDAVAEKIERGDYSDVP